MVYFERKCKKMQEKCHRKEDFSFFHFQFSIKSSTFAPAFEHIPAERRFV